MAAATTTAKCLQRIVTCNLAMRHRFTTKLATRTADDIHRHHQGRHQSWSVIRFYATAGDSFGSFRARLDTNLSEIRVLPKDEREGFPEFSADDEANKKVDGKFDEFEDFDWDEKAESEEEKLAGISNKFVDLMGRYGHRVTPNGVATFEALVTRQPYNANRWIKHLTKRPDLLEVDAQDLLAFVDFCLIELAVSKAKSFEFLLALPLGLFDQPHLYRNILLNWLAFCERYDIRGSVGVLASNPLILSCQPEQWEDRIEDLREIFNVKRFMGKLITNNPGVLTEHGGTLKRKLDYFIKVMHVYPKDIAEADCLSQDLIMIKKRFMFLEKCGLYKHPRPKDFGTSKSAEPPIKDIAQSTDQEFIDDVVGDAADLTLEEFDAFVSTILPEELEDAHGGGGGGSSKRELAKDLQMAQEAREMADEEGFVDDSMRDDVEEDYQLNEKSKRHKRQRVKHLASSADFAIKRGVH